MKGLYIFCASFFSFLILISATGHKKSGCLEKDKALALLENAGDLLSKAGNSFLSCNKNLNSTDNSECEAEKPLAYLEIAKRHISDVRENFPTCTKPTEKDKKLKDCSEILASGRNKSGVYTISLPTAVPFTVEKPLQVYCDMETDKGGWTVIQRRGKFRLQQDFDQDWETYKNGFGNLSEEFWLGNENIKILCLKGCEIRFDLRDAKGEKRYANYQIFYLSGSNYRLWIYNYNGGSAGDGMYTHNDLDFATKDKDRYSKASQLKGGWWYHNLPKNYNTNLNGIYHPGKPAEKYIVWSSLEIPKGLAGVEIKVRPKKV